MWTRPVVYLVWVTFGGGICLASPLPAQPGHARLKAGAAVAVAVDPQYDTTHVYVDPRDLDRFVASLIATFGGTAGKPGVLTVTPTPSETLSQLVLTPAGSFSVFGYKTPIPYPFGAERTGYLVKDMDTAITAARAAGADILVTPFADPIGRDAILRWPGGVDMQIYWHTVAPSLPNLRTVPENRVYLAKESADDFIRRFVRFSRGKVIADEHDAPALEIGRPGETFRAISVESAFGKMRVLVTDGHLPYPYGREVTGYEVANLPETLDKATGAGVIVLVTPYTVGDRRSAMVQFPGGFIAEIHAPTGP